MHSARSDAVRGAGGCPRPRDSPMPFTDHPGVRVLSPVLIYRQMGDSAQRQFASSWGINFGLDSAKEWHDVAKEGLKTSVILVVLDLLLIMGPRVWFQEHLDHLSVQCTLFACFAESWWQRTWALVQQQKRLSND
jgi:hypothetical protein